MTSAGRTDPVPQVAPPVTVAVLTFRRPDCLARILPLLVREARTVAARVLVVDNDPDAGARAFVTAHAEDGVRYVHEPVPGIAAARNRALVEATDQGAHAVAFIDDDEEPVDGWLVALVDRWLRDGATAVTGPVEPVYEKPADAWVLASGRFTRRSRASGTVVRSAASNNLLLDLAAVAALNLSFDLSFGLTGGEDTLFTHALTERGGTIVWCEEAVVRDHIPADRMTRSWILRRDFRSGTSYTRMRLVRTNGPWRRTVVRGDLAARGILRAAGSLLRWGWGRVTGDVTRQARGACRAAANAGLVAGTVGHRYREYGR